MRLFVRSSSLPRRHAPRLRRAALALFVAVAALCASAQARFEWRDVVQTIDLEPGGAVLIDDVRTLWTDEDFGEAFICIPLAPGETLELLPESGAVDPGPPVTARTAPCASGEPGVEMIVAHDGGVRVSERRVRFRYRLFGTLDVHADVVQWYWNTIRDEHPPIVGFRLEARAPGAMAFPYDAYVHRYDNPEEPTVRLSEDRDRLEVAFERIPADTPLELRWLMDPAVFEVEGSGDRLETFLEDEARVAGLIDRDRRLGQLRRSPWWGVVPLAGLLALGFGMLRAWRRVGREPDLPTMKYPFEPPSDIPPAAVVALRMQTFQSGGMSNAFRATVMDLARRGYGEFAGSEKRFEMVLHPEADPAALEPFERDVLEFLASAAASGRGGGAGDPLAWLRSAVGGGADDDPHHLAFGEFKSYAEGHLSSFMKRWGPKVRSWVEARFGEPLVRPESRAATQRWSGIGFAFAALSGLAAFLLLGPARAAMLVGVGGGIAAIVVANVALPSWRTEVAREVYAWNGFQRTLADYTRMKDAPLDFYRLWDRYFVYAAAFGVAERFLKALRRAAPEAGVDPDGLTRQASWMGPGVARSGDFGALSSSVSSLSSALSSASASASSGGSSSGGGGGGGGGGSSGGR